MQARSRSDSRAKLTGAADRFNCGEHPQSREDFRIDGIASGFAFHRLDFLIQRGKIERIDIRPHHTDPMIAGNQLVQRGGPPLDLSPLGPLDPCPILSLMMLRNCSCKSFSASRSVLPGQFQKNHNLVESQLPAANAVQMPRRA